MVVSKSSKIKIRSRNMAIEAIYDRFLLIWVSGEHFELVRWAIGALFVA